MRNEAHASGSAALRRTHCPLRTIASHFNCFECDAARAPIVCIRSAAYTHGRIPPLARVNIHEMLSKENGTPTTATVNVQERC